MLLSFVTNGATIGPEAQLSKADSLREEKKMVQALMMYESTLSEPLSGCEIARAHSGLAHIQIHAGNIDEALLHMTLATDQCGMCSSDIRSPMTLALSKMHASCGNPEEALKLLLKELEWGPQPQHFDQIELAIAELNLALGNWGETWRLTSQMPGIRALGLHIHSGVLMDIPLQALPIEKLIHEHNEQRGDQVLSELNHVHTALTGLGRLQEAFELSKMMAGIFNEKLNSDEWALAQLRVALSADRAQMPMDALMAFHEAERVVRTSDNPALHARIAREQAQFEKKRGATDKALDCLTLADSLTASMLQVSQDESQSWPREFDPFEAAVADSMKPVHSSGAWPFAFALAALGLLAAALRSRELRKELRKERVRSLRLQRTILSEPALAQDDAIWETTHAPMSSMTEQALSQPERLDFDDIIASLEMDHGPTVDWELECNDEQQPAPEGLLSLLSVTIKRLMLEKQRGVTYSGRIRSDWHGIHVEISGPESTSTKELEGIFVGGNHSKTWSPVLAQIENLAGQLTLEKRASGDLALMFLLPYSRP